MKELLKRKERKIGYLERLKLIAELTGEIKELEKKRITAKSKIREAIVNGSPIEIVCEIVETYGNPRRISEEIEIRKIRIGILKNMRLKEWE